MKLHNISIFLGAVCLVLMMNAYIAFADEYRDMGNPDDFSSSENIYFDRETDFGGDGWPFYWYNLNTTDFPGSFAWFENGSEFRWATAPSNINGWISSRAIKYRHFGRFRVDATSFSLNGNGNPTVILYLTIRYKDDIRPGSDNGCPVYSWDGSQWVLQGLMGGTTDHRWKSQQFIIEPHEVRVVSNRFIFKIGLSIYSDGIIGELPIDEIKLADDADISEFEPDSDGVWPSSPASNFSNLGRNNEFILGEGPFFPFGIHNSALWISHGGNATSPGSGDKDTWQCMEDVKMNMYSFHGWEQEWYSKWLEWPYEFNWDDPGIAVEIGLDEHLVQAVGHGLKVFPNTYTDTQAWWVKHQYGSAQNCLDYLAKVASDHQNNPALGAWYIIDEWDHEDGYYGRPHLFSHQLATRIRKADPYTPVLILSMGFMGPTTWQITSESADLVVTDVYPVHPHTFNEGLQRQAERLDNIRSVLGNNGAYILMGMGYNYNDGAIIPVDNQVRAFSTAEIVAQAYIGITHGAKGIIYWCGLFGHPEFRSNNWSVENSTQIWEGFRQIGEELFGNEAIAPILLSPSITLEIMGENRIVTASDPDIHYILKQTQEGKKFLIAIRSSNTTSGNVTFTIKNLEAETPIYTRFENGRIINSEDGQFSDYFGPLERHIYQLSGSIVPVELVNFTATVDGQSVILSWKTISETNNLGFEVQRSSDNINFRKIGFVQGSGMQREPVTYQFVDRNLPISSYYYRLKQIDYRGDFKYYNLGEIIVSPPKSVELYPNYPNPFNSGTAISYDLPQKSFVNINIFDILGNKVRTLVKTEQNAGHHQTKWDGRNDFGSRVASGIYLYQLKVNNNFKKFRKMILVQ